MTLQVDASTPAAAVGATTTTTTASFSPPANSLLVAFGMGDASDGSTDEALTVSSTGGLSWSLKTRANGSPGSTVEVWQAQAASAPGSITVSVTDNKGAVDKRLRVVVFTDSGGGIPAGIGASTATAGQSAAYTSTIAGSWGWSVGLGGPGTPVAGTGQTLDDFDTSFDGGDGTWVLKQNATTATPGTTVTMSETAPASVAHHLAVEILPQATGMPPPPPQRSAPVRDYGEVQWSQSSRKLTDLVATAANPLDTPLLGGVTTWWRASTAATNADRREVPQQRAYISNPDLLTTAELEGPLLGGADDLRRRYLTAGYWDRREVPQQRAYISDPNLLTTALLESPLLGEADAARRRVWPINTPDRREVPQQRPYISPPDLLTTALLESPLLGAADDLRRHAQAADFVDRREVPQQRLYISPPDLLATALLEPPLLGQADVARHGYPAAFVDRRLVPQQRAYISPPGLLDDAELEGVLLGGADTIRHLTWFVDRRLVPQQRPYISVPGLLDTALLESPLLGWAGTRERYNLAATNTDRREVPQQRAYISDPSFYPITTPTDPLTVAWGAGGPYWLLYNTAALQVDRREVPQQRPYISNPDLLVTALLESPLLGQADVTRHGQPAGFVDRRLVPQQRLYISPPDLLDTAQLDVPLLTPLNRQIITDRRVYPAQPRTFILDDGGGGTDPLTVAAGVGGDIWRRYNTPATHTDRREAPTRITVWFNFPTLPARVLSFEFGGIQPKWMFTGDLGSAWAFGAPEPKWMFNSLQNTEGAVQIGSPMIQSVLSTAYVQIPVAAFEAGLPVDPTSDVVAIAFTTIGGTPDSGDWHTGSWDTAPSGSYLAQVLVGPSGGVALSRGIYQVWVRVTDSPEVPVAQVNGALQIV